MQTIVTVIAILGITTSHALAGEVRETMVSNLFIILFLGFGAIILICQLIPGLMLFCSMMKGFFGKGEEKREGIIALTPKLGLTLPDGGRPVREAVEETVPSTDKTEEISDHDRGKQKR